MKTVKHTLMFLACSAAISSFAQATPPQCGATNFDSSKNIFTVMNPAAGAVNQQCLLTVYPTGKIPGEARQSPSSYLAEGSYTIDISGGGGGGGGGAAREAAGGSGGAGAAPQRTVQYLSPGIYKLTLGTGGEGGSAAGGRTGSGNPSSLTNAGTGQLIAGFAGADSWSQHSRAANSTGGGVAPVGGSSGGDGGGTDGKHDAAQAGGMSQTGGNSGVPGQAGTERHYDNDRNAGGGGGAGFGSGGVGGSANGKSAIAAGDGDLGGGGGGGRGGEHNTAEAGGHGGDGFIRLTMSGPGRPAIAPAPQVVVVETTTVIEKYSLSSDTLFGFGKSTIKPTGNERLDELADKLSNVSVESITVTGHTDRIGTKEANQKLSLDRAETVKAYLVNAGVRSDRISVSGMGESQPVTSAASCQGKATPKVISCLQQDRRVEIEVAAAKVAM